VETFYVQCALKTANSYRSPTHPALWWFLMLNGLFGLSGTLNSRATKSSWALNQAFYYKATNATSSRSSTVPRQAYGSFVFYLLLLYTIAFTLFIWLHRVPNLLVHKPLNIPIPDFRIMNA
jgi:hypothetical protein